MDTCEKLPLKYYGLTLDQIKNILESYPLAMLVREAKKDSLKAQQAILVKIDLGIFEFEGMSSEERLVRLVEFWDAIEATTSGLRDFHIANSVIEIACNSKWYDFPVTPPSEAMCIAAIRGIFKKPDDQKYYIRKLKDALA